LLDPARLAAVRIVTDWEQSPSGRLKGHLHTFFDKHPGDLRFHARVQDLTSGTVRWRRRLDYGLKYLFKGAYSRLQPFLKNALRVGAYELDQRGEKPYAVVQQYAELVKHRHNAKAAGLVNAILRRFSELNLDQLADDRIVDPIEKLAVLASHPTWMVRRWTERWGLAATRGLCEYNNHPPSTWVRFNPLNCKREDWENRLSEEGFSWEKHVLFNKYYLVKPLGELLESDLYRQGCFMVQDVAAGIAVSVLAPEAGEVVYDFCAAPGGKTIQLAQALKGQGILVAVESDFNRTLRIKKNLSRLRISHVQLITADVTKLHLPPADKILLDVPCSGTGVFARRVDARWRRRPTDPETFQHTQLKLLHSAWKMLRPGGILIYSTCTLEWEENQGTVLEFLKDTPSARLAPIENETLKPYFAERGMVETHPWRDAMDGVFVAKLRKES